MSTPAIVTFGETLALVRAQDIGSFEHINNLALGVGGAESNVAIAASRLGVPTRWIGRVGDDPLGRRITRELRAEQVDVIAVEDASAPTALMLKERRTSDTSQVLYYRGGSAGSRLSPEDIATEHLTGATFLHVTGITAALSTTAAATLDHALDLAQDLGVAVTFDVNHRHRLWSSPSDAVAAYRRIVSRSAIVFAGEDEARLLTGSDGDAEQLAHLMAAMGPSQAVVKRGASGAIAVVDGVVHHRDAIALHAIDTVGAGDGFVAGYLVGMLDGRDIKGRLDLAVTVGAFACLNRGDWEGYPRRVELGMLASTDPVTR